DIYGNTFAAVTRIDCTGESCTHELIQVGPAGAVHLRSDSTDPGAAWQKVPWLGGPVVTAQERVLWSRGRFAGDTGAFDLATRVFTPRVGAVFLDYLHNGASTLYASNALVGLELRVDPSFLVKYFVDVQADGTLPSVYTAQGFEIIENYALGGIPIP